MEKVEELMLVVMDDGQMKKVEKPLFAIMGDESGELCKNENYSFVEFKICDDLDNLKCIRDWCDARIKERGSNESSRPQESG